MSNPTTPNTYFPLGIGNRGQFVGGDEVITIEILDKTKLIKGVTCVVVNDLVEVDGDPVEDTDDWFALAKNGDVYYCGEGVLDLETFDGDKLGILFFGTPVAGVSHRQEWSVSNAEDAATILSTTYSYGSDASIRLAAQRGSSPTCPSRTIRIGARCAATTRSRPTRHRDPSSLRA